MTPTIRVLLVDDEPRARARLRRLLGAHPDVSVVGEAGSGQEGLQHVLTVRPDVVFLDVRMPAGTGTEMAEQLIAYLPEGVRPAVVFTTAHAEHAVQAFAVQGLDYLLKPIERDRLAEALRRVRSRVWAAHPTAAAPAAPEPPPAVLEGQRGASTLPVAIGQIAVIQMEDGLAFAVTVDGERIRLGDALGELEAVLPSPPFVRVSRSAILHVERVTAVRAAGAGTLEADVDGAGTIAVSRRRAKRLRAMMGLDG